VVTAILVGGGQTAVATEVPVSALGVMAPDTPPDLTGTTVEQHSITVGGVARTYRSIRPRDAAGRLPMLVVLHGRGEGPWTVVRTTGFLPLARTGKAVLLYPDGLNKSWNAGAGCCGSSGQRNVPDTSFLTAVVKAAESALPVDPSRVYLAGYSNGGKLAYTVACTAPTMFAGVATYGAVPLTPCAGASPLPFLLAAGAHDTILPINGAGRAHPPTAPVRTAASWLATRDRCTAAAPVQQSNGSTTVSRWTGCALGSGVELVVYPRADHAWPSSAATLMWAFLEPLRNASVGSDSTSVPVPA
jgi:polyhydroxybutyrate depolymerase